MKNKNIIRIALVTAFILLVPLVAMQFTDEVVWTLIDFVTAGVLLFGSGLAYELIGSKGGNTAYRVAAGVAIGTTLLLIWVNLAVGLIGSGPNAANLMYIGVPAVGIIGGVIARLRPQGMAGALFATALAQALVPVIALIICRPEVTRDPPGVLGIFVLNAFFVVMFVVSALLFRRAGATSTQPTA